MVVGYLDILVFEEVVFTDGSMIDPLTRKCSPRVMTSLGKQLFELSGAAKVLDENSELEKSA